MSSNLHLNLLTIVIDSLNLCVQIDSGDVEIPEE